MASVAAGGCRRRPADEPPEVGDAVTAQAIPGPVTIRGLVVEAGTGAPIAGAVVIVLAAGVTSQQWLDTPGEEATAELMEGTTLTDSAGGYEIAALERGQSYTVMVTAEGYAPAIFEGGLEVAEDDPVVTEVRPVELDPR